MGVNWVEELAHTPVMLQEVLQYLKPVPGAMILDATVGWGGHAEAIAKCLPPGGLLVGIDRDPLAIAAARERLAVFGAGTTLINANFSDLSAVLDTFARPLDGALFDLGVSSPQLDDPGRGFSYRADAPLDMRMDPHETVSAYHLVNGLSEAELESIIRRFGEERWAKRIAAFIVRRRNTHGLIHTTGELVDVICAAVPVQGRSRGGMHPARRTFQALRIAVNNELGSLEAALREVVPYLRPGGRLVVISFHSLEDRIAKNVLREFARDCTCPPEWHVCQCGGGHALVRSLTPHPVRPSDAELAVNPRARSAKMRVVERCAEGQPAGDVGGEMLRLHGSGGDVDVPSLADTLARWEPGAATRSARGRSRGGPLRPTPGSVVL